MLHQPAFGKRLRQLRLERGLSQTALGDGEVSAAYLSRLESGARPPTPRVATFLANRLGVPITAFADPTAPSVATLLAELRSSVEPSPVTTVAIGKALRDDPSVDPAVRWQALWALVEAGTGNHGPDSDLAPVTELVELAPHLGVPELVCRSEALYARMLRMQGRYDDAREHALAAVAAAEDVSGASDKTLALLELIAVDGDDGRLIDASRHAEEVLRVVEGECCVLVAKALWANATVAFLRGDHKAAADHMASALSHVDARDDLTLWIRLHLAASSLYLHTNPPDVELARTQLDTLAPIARLLGEPQQLQELEAQLAHLAFADGDLAGAEQRADALLANPESLLTHRDRVRLETLRGRVMILTDRRSAGVAHLRQLASGTKAAALSSEVYRVLADALADSLDRLEA